MMMLILRGLIAGAIVVTVSEVAGRSPRLGALVLSLPIVSLITLVFTWYRHESLVTVERLARETPILVLVGLPFFLPLAFASRLGFWNAYVAGVILACVTIGLWLWLAPKTI